VARQTGVWLQWRDPQPAPQDTSKSLPQLTLDATAIEGHNEHTRAQQSWCTEAFADHVCLRLTYEALAAELEVQFNAVAAFLGVARPAVWEIPITKQISRPRDVVLNLDALARHFARSEHAWKFEAALPV
jgi:hypothetical protein